MPKKSPFVCSSLLLSMLPAFAAAQQPQAGDFLVADAQARVTVDFVAMRKLGLWDDLEASLLNVAFARIEKEAGFPLDALDRFHACALVEGGDVGRGTRQVLVWEGNRDLAVHASYSGASWQAERIGEHDVRRRDSSRGDEVFVKLRPELMVCGSAEIVEPALLGQRPTALVPPDVQSLLSGREGRVCWLMMQLDHAALRERFLHRVMGADLEAWPAGDRPAWLTAQFLVTGDADDPHVELRAVLRHLTEGEGVAVSVKAIDAFVGKLRDDARLKAIHPLLKKAAAQRDHGDAVIQIDFGRSRDAVGNLATLLLPVIGRDGAGPGAGSAPAGGDGK